MAKAGKTAEAEAVVAALIAEEFRRPVRSLSINRDAYSLNSLNGFVTTDAGAFFFKFHQEEGEDRMSGEYYRARLLAEAGLPVDLPVETSTKPGRQILLYRLRKDRRLAEVARDLDAERDPAKLAPVIEAQAALDRAVAEVYLRTLHPITAEQSRGEPIHRLFHERLRDFDRPGVIGGRFAAFYRDQDFVLPGVTLNWRALRGLRISFNGVTYRDSLGALFDAAFTGLEPGRFEGLGVTAHGDAHNANVWYEENEQPPRLSLFDPAFAGTHVPALLAEVKPTFHNIFAHPFWLYEPQVAATRFRANVERRGDVLAIETDWALSPLRTAFLERKAALLWRPLLAAMQARDQLPQDWRRLVKLALFCCPTLVMNLRANGTTPGAGAHNPVSSAIGLGIAAMMGSVPLEGAGDVLSAFLDSIEPNGSGRKP
ncbi:hypothetical protein [Dongia sedimenti]|uniref:Aminoglycoside phosphotransferase domain-containing protein n=1 Tax=Dongia sedimenti TaxID=3064282 RepID=A0ABU0YG43_9PROT|nr:hypothetical protein [Rhodospirillaceae bacterium R-7]